MRGEEETAKRIAGKAELLAMLEGLECDFLREEEEFQALLEKYRNA